jgi:hypothetical protein
LKEIQKQIQIPGKGHNETLEIVNPLKHMRAVAVIVQGHVPENGGTCNSLFVADMSGKILPVDSHDVLRFAGCFPK